MAPQPNDQTFADDQVTILGPENIIQNYEDAHRTAVSPLNYLSLGPGFDLGVAIEIFPLKNYGNIGLTSFIKFILKIFPSPQYHIVGLPHKCR